MAYSIALRVASMVEIERKELLRLCGLLSADSKFALANKNVGNVLVFRELP